MVRCLKHLKYILQPYFLRIIQMHEKTVTVRNSAASGTVSSVRMRRAHLFSFFADKDSIMQTPPSSRNASGAAL